MSPCLTCGKGPGWHRHLAPGVSPRCADGRISSLPWEAVAEAERAVTEYVTVTVGPESTPPRARLWPPAEQIPLPFPG